MIISVENKQRRRAVFAALLFIILAVLIGTNASFPANMDESVRFFMSSIQTNYGDAIMSASSFLGSPLMNLIYGVLLAVVLLLADLKLPAFWVLFTSFGGAGLVELIKLLIHRERPVGHLLTDSGYAFPSVYVTTVWIMVFIMFLLVTANINSIVLRIFVKWLLITVALMDMLARLYFSSHYLSDVVAGFLLAYVWVVFCATLYPFAARYLIKHFWSLKDQEA